MYSLSTTNGKRLFLYALAVTLALPVAHYVFSWSKNTYSFLALYRPEQLFRETADPTVPIEEKKTLILESLNAEIEQDSRFKRRQESWLLAHLDRLWYSVREYVSPSGKKEDPVLARSGSATPEMMPSSRTSPAHSEPTEPKAAAVVQNVLTLANDPEIMGSVSENTRGTRAPSRGGSKSLFAVSAESLDQIEEREKNAAAELLYRFESMKGVRTKSMICKLHEGLALEGTVEATPVGETDPDLSDFGFRTVHALNFLRDRPTPALMAGRAGVQSGYPVSYGIGLNYQVSPILNLRFDYAHESPTDYFVESNGSWESSIVTSYNKHQREDTLSVHSFFVGLRYLHQARTALIPLHTGFFYSTNMSDEPLDSNVSLGFSIGGGINRRNIRLGFAYRFRIWDNPEDHLLKEQGLKELDTRLSNQFLLTLVF